jgi:hypothetical protein
MSGEEAAVNLFWAIRSSSSPGSVAELRLRRSGVGEGVGMEISGKGGVSQESSKKLRATRVCISVGKLHGQTGRG